MPDRTFADEHLAPGGELRATRATLDEAIASYDRIIDEQLVNVGSAIKPQVEGQLEFTKMMTTISSGSLVLSISVAQLVGPKIQHPRMGWLLAASWIVFAAVIVLATVRTQWLQNAQLYAASMEGIRADIRVALRRFPTEQEMSDVLAQTIEPQMTAAVKSAVAHHTRLVHSQSAGIIGIAVAMAALVAFAVANSPF